MWRIFRSNRSRPSRPSPSLAGSTTSRRWASNAPSAALAVAAASRSLGCSASIAGSPAAPPPRRARRRSARRCRAAGAARSRSGTGRPAGPSMPTSALARAVEDRAACPRAGPRPRRAGRPAARTRGRCSVNMPLAEQVDPVERVPGVLAQLGLGEPRGLQLADDQVAVDRLVGAQVASWPRSAPAIGRRPPAGRGARPRSRRATRCRGRARRSRWRGRGSARRTRRGTRRRRRRSRTWPKCSGRGVDGAQRRRYHRPDASADVGRAGRPRGNARPPGAALAATISTTSPRSPSTRRSGSGRSWGRRTRPACGAGWRRALANAEAGTERPFATIDLASGRAIGSSRYMSIVPEHQRLEIGWTWVATSAPADRRQPRGQAAPADPRVRDAWRQPRRVQDALAERALAHGARGHRRDVRGRLPQPLDHARRLDPGLRVLQRHRPRMAGGQGAARRRPGALSGRHSRSRPRFGRDILAARHRRHRFRGGRMKGFIVGTIATAITFAIVSYLLAADRLRRQPPDAHRASRSSSASSTGSSRQWSRPCRCRSR